jgi:pSer/pThr/pTyr-binding forkhead associated (FHA) protein
MAKLPPDMKPVPQRAPSVPSAPPPPGRPRIALRLTKIGPSEEQVYRAEFAGRLAIGRDASNDLSFAEDKLLSSRHCAISYEADGVILRDLGSTNKTFVNGVPITDRHILENDDVLLIGSMELRVNWEPIK